MNKMIGNYYDLQDCADVYEKNIKINIGNWESDIYIITAGIPRIKSSDVHDFWENYNIVRRLLERCAPEKPILIATNPVKLICKQIEKEFNIKTIPITDLLDSARETRTDDNPENVAIAIIDNKGYTEFGVAAEIVQTIKILIKGIKKR